MIQTRWFWPLIAVLFCWIFYIAMPVLTPFVIAALLAYLTNPAITRLQEWHLSRTFAAIIIFIILFGALILLFVYGVPILQAQTTAFIGKLPVALVWVQQNILPWLREHGIMIEPWNMNTLQANWMSHWQEMGQYASVAWDTLLQSGRAVFGWAVNIVLIPIITFYLMRDWPLVGRWFNELLPRSTAPTIMRLARESDDVLGAFLRGQFWIILCLTILYSIALTWLGLPFAFLLGLLGALLNVIPYIGVLLGMLIAGLVTVLQFQMFTPLWYILGIFTAGHLLESMILTPWFMGNRIGLHPVMVIFAILLGGKWFGIVGVLLALPVSAILKVVWHYLKTQYLHSHYYIQRL